MLEEQQMVVVGGLQRPLEGDTVVVRDSSEPADPQGRRGRGGGQWTSASQSRVSMISLSRWRKAAA